MALANESTEIRHPVPPGPKGTEVSQASPAEETMRLLAEGKSFEEIAQIRGRQFQTVINMVADLVEKGRLEYRLEWVGEAHHRHNDMQTILQYSKIFKNPSWLSYLYVLTYAELSAVNRSCTHTMERIAPGRALHKNKACTRRTPDRRADRSANKTPHGKTDGILSWNSCSRFRRAGSFTPP